METSYIEKGWKWYKFISYKDNNKKVKDTKYFSHLNVNVNNKISILGRNDCKIIYRSFILGNVDKARVLLSNFLLNFFLI